MTADQIALFYEIYFVILKKGLCSLDKVSETKFWVSYFYVQKHTCCGLIVVCKSFYLTKPRCSNA